MKIGPYAAAAALTIGVAACGGGGSVPSGPGDPVVGRELFAETCTACHGPEGEGVAGHAASLADSELIATAPDFEVIEVIRKGVAAGDERNKTGVPMPRRGGNPTLSNQDLADIVAWLRTIGEEG